MKRKIIYLTSFGDLGVLYTSFYSFFELLNKNFDQIFFVNSDNLRIFSKKIKFYKNINNKFPKNFIFENPLNYSELKKKIDFRKSVIINNTSRKFNYYKLIYFLSKIKVPQILVSHTGYMQGSVYYFWKKNINYFISLFTNHLPKKIATILVFFKIFRKIDIRFTSNKKLYNSFYLNKKKLFSKPSIYKEIILVKSKQFSEKIKINNKNEYITLIDFQPDYREMKESTSSFKKNKVDEHYKNVILLLNKLKKIYNKKIAICIHPLYNLKKISKIYNNFKVYKYRTKEFITKSFIVLFYDSSSLVDAIIQKKKIIALKTDLYKSKKDMSDLWTDIIPFKKLNISNDIKINKNKLIKELDNKISLYDKYLINYGSQNQKEDGNKKIIRIIKKKFFKN